MDNGKCYICGTPWSENGVTYWPHRDVESLRLSDVPTTALMRCDNCDDSFANEGFTDYVVAAYMRHLSPKISAQLAQLVDRGVVIRSLERTLGFEVGELSGELNEQRATLLHVALHFILLTGDPVEALNNYRRELNSE